MIECLTALLVIITAFYAWATFHILKANKAVVALMFEQSEALTRPYVTASVFLLPDSPLFTLRISNTGKTPATNLRLTLDDAFHKYGEISPENNLSNYVAFKEKIDSFPPGAELYFDLAQSFVIFGENANKNSTPTVFSISAEYTYGNKTVTEKNTIDLRPYYKSNLPENPYIDQLNKLRESIDKASDKIQRELEKGRKK